MKKNLPALFVLSCVLLAACGKTDTTTVINYKMMLDANMQDKRLELINASQRIMGYRLLAANIKAVPTAIPSGQTEGLLTIRLTNPKDLAAAKKIIERPFAFDIRTEIVPTPNGKKPDDANWQKTGITEKHVLWIQVLADKASGSIAAEIQLTPEGRKKMEAVFADLAKQNQALILKAMPKSKVAPPVLNIGIFLRDSLISELTPSGSQLQSRVIISGIPSASVAQIFADDVNTGIHVHFVPQ